METWAAGLVGLKANGMREILHKIGCGIGLLLTMTTGVAAASVSLAWDPSAGPDVTGYRLYQGSASGTYTNVVDVGNATNAMVPNLVGGATYFFAVTAYDSLGLESIFSNEVSYTVTNNFLARLQIELSSPSHVLLSGTGPAGYQYNLLQSGDLTNWTPMTNLTMDASGTFQLSLGISAGAVTNLLPQGGPLPAGAASTASYFRLQQTYP